MRPSVRAEKYIRDASGWWKDVTDGNDNGTDGQTDRRTDRVRRNMRPPPREEGRIIIWTKQINDVNYQGRTSGGMKKICTICAAVRSFISQAAVIQSSATLAYSRSVHHRCILRVKTVHTLTISIMVHIICLYLNILPSAAVFSIILRKRFTRYSIHSCGVVSTWLVLSERIFFFWQNEHIYWKYRKKIRCLFPNTCTHTF